MAKRKVRRRARKILGADPTALVWCELARPIPAPPEQVHRAAGSKRLTPGRHWLLYAGAVLFFFVVIPMMLIDKLGDRLERRPAGRRAPHPRHEPDSASTSTPGSESADAATSPRPPAPGRDRRGRRRPGDPAHGLFDGDWERTAGRLLLHWYGHSPNPQRLVMLTGDGICVAASPRRRLSPTTAGDFHAVARFSPAEARIEAEAGQPRGFATFALHFPDGSWLELGRLAGPDDADHFLRTVSS
ncbi:hypothetical protein [Streptomyces sp. PanSC9]|uniref:hypothetical protein n=1 Tax=Streptomyces sp. PanSC9 TaxID=1520461 RepID=UPI000F4880A4|nr:hypothetical protein [Streptomyces sp. PanSC9]ROP56008.1 hypothetical protein EDD94_5603 [Streptomyces sp. PanSC9]